MADDPPKKKGGRDKKILVSPSLLEEFSALKKQLEGACISWPVFSAPCSFSMKKWVH